MIIQRETEEFRASKTHSALVDQSYQSPVIRDKKGVKNRALTHERNLQRARLLLLSLIFPRLTWRVPGVLLGWAERLKAGLKQSKVAVYSAVAISHLAYNTLAFEPLTKPQSSLCVRRHKSLPLT